MNKKNGKETNFLFIMYESLSFLNSIQCLLNFIISNNVYVIDYNGVSHVGYYISLFSMYFMNALRRLLYCKMTSTALKFSSYQYYRLGNKYTKQFIRRKTFHWINNICFYLSFFDSCLVQNNNNERHCALYI